MKWISMLLVIGPPLAFGFIGGRPTEMGLAIAAGGLAAGFLNLDKFVRLKGAGFEAELKQTLDEAKATVEQLRGVARPLILASLGQITWAGRWGGMDDDDKEAQFEALHSAWRAVGLETDERFCAAADEFFRLQVIDRSNDLMQALTKANRPAEAHQLGELIQNARPNPPDDASVLRLAGAVPSGEMSQLIAAYQSTRRRAREYKR